MKLHYALAALAVAAMSFGASAQVTDVTTQYLGADAGFNGPEYNFDKNASGSIDQQSAELKGAEGWSHNDLAGYWALGTVEYGSQVKLKGQGVVPTEGYMGSEGGCLGLAAAWSATVYVYHEVTLPAGKYTLNVPTYNCSTSGKNPKNVEQNLTGWIPDNGTAVMNPLTTFDKDTWVLQKIQFTLTEETTGKIQLGYKSPNKGSDENVQLAIDYVQLMYEPLTGSPANLLTNASFANNAQEWVNYAKNGETTIADGVVTVTSTGRDNIVAQPIYLNANKSYTFIAKYKTNGYENNGAFAGFWNWNGSAQSYTAGAYADYPAVNDWTQISSTIKVGDKGASKAVVLSVVGNGKEVSYKDVEVIENPVLSINGLGIVNNPITVASNFEGFDLFYQAPEGELTAGDTFTPTVAGEYKVAAKYKGITVAESSIVILEGTVYNDDNLMKDAIIGHLATTAPTAPWLAYNTESNELGGGNGWVFRNTNGESGTAHGTGATQLFLRWDNSNSVWVYAYEITLPAGHTYKFTCDATTNDNKSNDLIVGVTKDLANAVELPGSSSYSLNDVNSDKLWTAPVKVEKTFDTTDASENTKYYIVFKSTNLGGNIIIRIANVSLVDEGEIPVTVPTLKVNGAEHTSNVIKTEEAIKISFDVVDGVEVYYKWTPVANTNALAEEEGDGFTLYREPINLDGKGTLQYYAKQYGRTSDIKTLNVDTTTGVAVIGVEAAKAEYFTLEGVRVDGNDLTPGVYVVRRGAKAEKILVK